MEEKKNIKFNSIISLISLLAVFTMLIGTSYAYFTKKIVNDGETRVIVKSANMLLRYNEGNQINGVDIEPGWTDTLNFSIENYSTDTVGKYKIILDIISPLISEEDENFVYTLTSSSTTTTSNNVLVSLNERSVPVVTTTLGTSTIDVSTTHNYSLKISLKDNNENQNYLKDKIFVAKITVENVYE